jgi:hypothetical protein
LKLTVNLTKLSPDWEIILNQIGVSYRVIRLNESIEPEHCAVLIVNSADFAAQKQPIIAYLENGGAALLEAEAAGQILGIPTGRVFIKYLHSLPEDAVFSETPICQVGRRCRVAKDALYLLNQSGQNTVAVKTIGKGAAVILPSGLVSAILSHKIKRRNFPAEGGERMPSERVSGVAKGGVRRIVQAALEFLFHFRELPFVNLWPFPNGAKNVFGFRVDSDFSTQNDVEQLYQTCQKNGIRAAWFVETRSAADWIDVYGEMKDQEIGYHCFRHRVFPGYLANKNDIEQGLQILKQANIEPRGYAAPYGEWQPVLGKVIEESGFRYSSEFALAYDDLPFFPWLHNSFSHVLQIPIHPISVGRLHWARHSEKQMFDYYLRVIQEKLALQEPVFLYHHPGQRRFELWDKIFQAVKEYDLLNLPPGEYAEWWRKRNAVKWFAEFTGGGLKVSSDSGDHSVWIRTSLPCGKTLLNSLTGNSQALPNGCEISKVKLLKRHDSKLLNQYTLQMLLHDFTWYYRRWKQ